MNKSIILPALVTVFLASCAQPEPAPPKPDLRSVVECSFPTWAYVQGSTAPGQVGKPALVGKDYGLAMTPIPLDAVQMTNRALAASVAIQSVAARRTATDTVQVTSRFVNCTDKTINMQVRTSFMDASQVPTEPVSAWRTVFVPPRATAVYQENSIGRGAVAHYLIEVAPY